MIWKLSRPKPALPSSYFWTWDHSTNWMTDDPGLLNFGDTNKYLKRPETFIEDYRRLVDFAAGLGVKGIVVWGFLRDSHGGVQSGKIITDYAVSKGIAIMPGIGATWYGGVYYEGEHPYNLETFLKKNPSARMITKAHEQVVYMAGMENVSGAPQDHGACPTHPLFTEWLQEGIQWLFREFEIGGVNLENGDFLVCHSPSCEANKANWPKDDPDFFRLQSLTYEPALECLKKQLDSKLITWATYAGFVLGKAPAGQFGPYMQYMQCERPVLIDRLPAQGIAQWTLTKMVLDKPLALTAYLDNGVPEEVFNNPNWPKGLCTPSKRSVGLIHQGSQWDKVGRYNQIISTIKETCLRAHLSGLEGVTLVGEVSSRYIPWALNYLAFSHFIHWPKDSLRDFGKKTLGQVFGKESDAEAFVEILAHWDAGALTDEHRKKAEAQAKELRMRVASAGKDLELWRFWDWLSKMANGITEPHTAGFF